MMNILISRCRDPRWNLAMEEYLIEDGKTLLYLWRNDPSVIIGRNQNPYAEVSLDVLKNQSIYLVRRKSGGGAVYHDPGNLNITLLTKKAPDTVENNFCFLISTLKTLGIHSQVSGRNDLESAGRKISGSAFYETEDRFCHHCTMLVHVDLMRLQQVLTPSKLKLSSKGIQSVRSRVANLSELNPAVTVESLAEALCRQAGGQIWEMSREQMEEMPGIREKAQRYSSWEWNYGESPSSNLCYEKKFSWGTIQAELNVVNGRIASCMISTDSLRTEGFRELSEELKERPFQKNSFSDAIRNFPDPEIQKDLSELFELQTISSGESRADELMERIPPGYREDSEYGRTFPGGLTNKRF